MFLKLLVIAKEFNAFIEENGDTTFLKIRK